MLPTCISRRVRCEREESFDFAPLSQKLARGERRSLVVLLAGVT